MSRKLTAKVPNDPLQVEEEQNLGPVGQLA